MTTPLAIIPGVTGGWELLLILALVLLLFGPKRLPEIAEAMGKSIRKFKSATSQATDEVKRELDDVAKEVKPEPPADDDGK
jgi:TatA/E family protein of Tat protein translocase